MMTRKQFLRSALELSAAALGLTVLSSCTGPRAPSPDGGVGRIDAPPGGLGSSNNGSGSGSGSGSASTPRCVQNGTNVTIGTNHGHVLVVTSDEIGAAQQKSYSIQGTSNHDHTVTLTAEEYDTLLADRAVMTKSTFDADHDHTILVACA